ncbi:MAG TPA: single-stranded-DNA-specific exonuclease RecJ, partial [Kiloniellales bacterium]|nr:single-stranded-DNA-specific exonuclease RecJ [Kiloniellales bacterium]
AATADLVRQIALCGPYGTGNAQPRFALPAIRVAHADVVGERHVRCSLQGADGGRIGGIAFRALESDLGPLLLRRDGRPLHVAGKLALDDWAGSERVQIIIDDAAPASR